MAAVAVGALAVPVTAVAVTIGSSPAWALSSVSCAKLTGTATTTITISECKPVKAGYTDVTGKTAALEGGGTITWHSSLKTTILGKPSFKVVGACAAAGSAKYSVTGKVTGGTAAYTKAGDAVSATVCVAKGTLALSLYPGTTMKM